MNNLVGLYLSLPIKKKQKQFKILSEGKRRELTARTNPACVFHNIIGQDSAVEDCLDIIYKTLGDPHRRFAYSAILMHGGKSNGKTTFSKLLAKALRVPFVETIGNQMKSAQDIFKLITDALNKEIKTRGTKNGRPFYVLPSLVLFIDEIHCLSKKAVDGLLKAIESNDRLLITSNVYVDFRNVLLIGATTERGDLFDAFESRFFKIEFFSYTPEEVAQIVNLEFPMLTFDECFEISQRSGLVIREAQDLARSVLLAKERSAISFSEALQVICNRKGLNENGLTTKQMWIIKKLSTNPQGLNYNQLARVAQCKSAELKEYILPGLINKGYLIWTGQRSYITKKGRELK